MTGRIASKLTTNSQCTHWVSVPLPPVDAARGSLFGIITLSGGFSSSLAGLAMGLVTFVFETLLHKRSCGPIVDVVPKPGVLFAELGIRLVSNLMRVVWWREKRTRSRSSERGPAWTSRQRDVAGIPAAVIPRWTDDYMGQGRRVSRKI